MLATYEILTRAVGAERGLAVPTGGVYRDIGRRIRAARERAGYSQEQVAEFLGTTGATYSRYESGKVRIPTGEVARLATYFDVDAGWLLTGEGGAASIRPGRFSLNFRQTHRIPDVCRARRRPP